MNLYFYTFERNLSSFDNFNVKFLYYKCYYAIMFKEKEEEMYEFGKF